MLVIQYNNLHMKSSYQKKASQYDKENPNRKMRILYVRHIPLDHFTTAL